MFASFLSGIGAAASSGLNAYLPLLILAMADRFTSTIDLNSPYDIIASTWGIVILLVLLPIELIADKIPGIDHASDLLHSAIRPAAAAFIMMALTDEKGHINAVVALIVGLAVGVVVHGVKATTRPAITLSTGGVGNPLISMVEDVAVVVTVIASIFFPLALILLLPLVGYGMFRAYMRMKQGSSRLRKLTGGQA